MKNLNLTIKNRQLFFLSSLYIFCYIFISVFTIKNDFNITGSFFNPFITDRIEIYLVLGTLVLVAPVFEEVFYRSIFTKFVFMKFGSLLTMLLIFLLYTYYLVTNRNQPLIISNNIDLVFEYIINTPNNIINFLLNNNSILSIGPAVYFSFEKLISNSLRMILFILWTAVYFLFKKKINPNIDNLFKKNLIYGLLSITVFTAAHFDQIQSNYWYLLHFVFLSIWLLSITKSKGLITSMFAHSFFNLTLIIINIFNFYINNQLFRDLEIFMILWLLITIGFVLSYTKTNPLKFVLLINSRLTK